MPTSTTPVWNDPARPVQERVQALLADLTLEEKVAQLGSYWKRPELGDAGGFAPMQSTFEEGRDPFEEAARNGLGHITRAFGSAPFEVADGVAHLRELQRIVIAGSRHGIPAIAHEESLTGLMAHRATTYPAAIAWGASFAPELVRAMARRIGADMRAIGTHLALSPVLDIVRDYRWGRIEETMGEDPFLTGTLATEYVRGLQESGIIATLKHFAGHAASRAGRNHAPVSIGPRELADVDLVPFEMAVRLGRAGAVMNSYADIDGIPPAASRALMTDLLRGTWGFEGTVVSDYWAVNFLQSMHRVVGSTREAAVATLRAGMDVELPETSCFVELPAAISAGELELEVLDTAVRRVLTQKVELGLLDAEFDATAAGDPAADLDSTGNHELARTLAEESIVLLRNAESTLPLQPTDGPSRVALIGPAATDPRTFLGCYSFTNHVLSRLSDAGTSVPMDDLATALGAELPDAVIETVRGTDFVDPDPSGIAEAVAAATSADLAILAVGDKAGLFGAGTSGEGCDVVDLSLPGAQGALLDAVLDTGTPVVLVLVTGRPYALGAVADRCAAIVQAFMPGQEGAAAIAGVLSGRVNPSGRLPVGIPAHVGGQPGTYLAPVLAWESDGISTLDPKPLYPFGHGLSYSSYEYSDLRISAQSIAPDGEVVISATVTNTSGRAGKEVAQLYLSDPVASVVRPLKRLVGFAKIALEAGESARVEFTLHADRTSFTGPDLRRIVEPGELVVRLGSSSEDRALEGSFRIEGPVRDIEGIERVMETPVRVVRPADAGQVGLRATAEAAGIPIGAAVAGGGHRRGIADEVLEDPLFREILDRDFASLTPENQMKWEVVHPARGTYDFGPADAVVDFAEAHGHQVRGHTLLWHSQNPAWLEEGEFTDEELREILHEHIAAVVGRYRGRIRHWDVANELIRDEDGELRLEQNIWLRRLGPGILADAFRWAHEADPEALLFLNDYSVEGIGQKSDANLRLLQELLAQGVPVHGFGVQGHLSLTQPFPDTLAENLRRFADLGLATALTEVDVRGSVDEDGRLSPADEQEQVRWYRRLVGAARATPGFTSLTVWGVLDSHSWVPGFFPGEGSALLRDEAGRRKPAFAAVEEALRAQES
ncbi:endo-1,4-beta-xylanase [Brachybacterium hainanense]|uniref:Endo-1,4-beta-xylanase n=1 Tax=Brachybacterium hainanense TaxID=1541174 RepID=A0ABV6RCG1_9MICO